MAFTPICVPCAREMRCRDNDYLFLDYEAAAVWAGDMYECERCRAQVVVGVARQPVAYSGDYQFVRYALHSQLELTCAEPAEELAAKLNRGDAP